MKVILLSGKKGHYYNTALGAQKAKCLDKFITTVYFKKFSKDILLKILGKNILERFKGIIFVRSDDKLNPKLVLPIFMPEILLQVLAKLSSSLKKRVNLICLYLFELLSIPYISKCDIFHVCSGFGLFTSRIAKRKGAIIIIDQGSSHPVYRKNLLYSEYKKYSSKCLLPDELWMEKVIKEYRLADYIFVPSKHVYNSFIKNGINPKKLFIIPYGVDIEKFKLISKNDDKFRIIYVGLLSLSKGVQYLLEAYKQLNLNNSELVLIGKVDDSFKSTLTEYKGLFTHISYVPNHELYKYYSNSSVFVHPSLTEGFALVTYEALACGIPSIVTENCGGIIRDGIDGFIIPVRDVEALKEKLVILYKDDNLREKMGISAREYVSNFTWEKYGEEVVKTYQKIMNMNKKQKPNVLIIGNPHSHPSAKAFLIKFLKVLSPLAEKIHIISGDDPRFYDNVHWIKMKKASYKLLPKKIISFLSFQLRLSFNLIKISKKADVVIFIPYTMIISMFTVKLKGVEILLHIGGSASKNIKYGEKLIYISLLFGITKIFEKIAFMLSDKLVIKSKSLLEFQNLKRHRDKVVIGGLYVDTDIFSYKNEIKKRNKIGYIGILDKLKGVDKFSKAVTVMQDYLNKTDIEVIIGGDGPLFDEIKNELKNNESYDKVKLTGWIPHEKLPDYLNELKLIVIPAYSEGLPNILLEAMACGTPVLATPVGAIPDVIKDGETGFTLENNSPDCIAKNIIRVLSHPNLKEIVENARKLIEKEYTYEAAVERYRKILENI